MIKIAIIAFPKQVKQSHWEKKHAMSINNSDTINIQEWTVLDIWMYCTSKSKQSVMAHRHGFTYNKYTCIIYVQTEKRHIHVLSCTCAY